MHTFICRFQIDTIFLHFPASLLVKIMFMYNVEVDCKFLLKYLYMYVEVVLSSDIVDTPLFSEQRLSFMASFDLVY